MKKYNPIEDEKRLFSMREWADQLKMAVDEYIEDMEGENDFMSTSHTWSEWMNSFIRYMSW